jgi:hypothetical protein
MIVKRGCGPHPASRLCDHPGKVKMNFELFARAKLGLQFPTHSPTYVRNSKNGKAEKKSRER